MVFASSSSPDERLGELLLRRGRITPRASSRTAGKALVPGKRLGTVLVEQGALSPKDLVRSVVEHTQEIIYGAFQWTEGQYRLQEGGDTTEAITLKISTPDLILEGIRRIDSWTRIDRAVGGLRRALRARAADYEARLRSVSLRLGEAGDPDRPRRACARSSRSARPPTSPTSRSAARCGPTA